MAVGLPWSVWLGLIGHCYVARHVAHDSSVWNARIWLEIEGSSILVAAEIERHRQKPDSARPTAAPSMGRRSGKARAARAMCVPSTCGSAVGASAAFEGDTAFVEKLLAHGSWLADADMAPDAGGMGPGAAESTGTAHDSGRQTVQTRPAASGRAKAEASSRHCVSSQHGFRKLEKRSASPAAAIDNAG